TILVLTGLREVIINAIPMSLKRATGAGIGLFTLFIGQNQAGFIAPGPSPAEPVTLATLRTWPVAVAALGLVLTAVLHAARVRGALLIGILATTVLATIVNYATGLTAFTTPGVARLPSSVAATPDLSLIGQVDPFGAWAL